MMLKRRNSVRQSTCDVPSVVSRDSVVGAKSYIWRRRSCLVPSVVFLLFSVSLQVCVDYRYFLFVGLLVFAAASDPIIAYKQDFEGLQDGQTMYGEKDVVVKNGIGKEGTNGLLVKYVPTSRGSDRLDESKSLPGRKEYTLSYDIMFVEPFDFKRGGKLHGLGGGKRTTGCDDKVPDGWSVRLMWIEWGMLQFYYYDQDDRGSCGANVMTWYYFPYPAGVWVHIDLYVRVNTIGGKDGETSLYVDGKHIMTLENLRLRGDVADDSIALVDSFMFSTFYGGADPSWAPDYTTYNIMDNIQVSEGLVVMSPTPATVPPTPAPIPAQTKYCRLICTSTKQKKKKKCPACITCESSCHDKKKKAKKRCINTCIAG